MKDLVERVFPFFEQFPLRGLRVPSSMGSQEFASREGRSLLSVPVRQL